MRNNSLRTAAIFFAVAAATFAATDPADLPPWAKALIGAAIAGLAAIGVTPPGKGPADIRDVQDVQVRATAQLARRVSDLEGAHGHVMDRIEDLEGAPPLAPPVPLAPIPPEPPAPEVPS